MSMEQIKRTLDLLTANVVQAECNTNSGSLGFLRQDLHMAALLAEQLQREISALEIKVEAQLRASHPSGDLPAPGRFLHTA